LGHDGLLRPWSAYARWQRARVRAALANLMRQATRAANFDALLKNGSAQYSTGRLLPCLTMISWGETGAPGASVPSMPPSSTSSAQVDLAARALTHHARIVKRLRACEREFKSASRSSHDASDASAAGASRRKIAIDATVRKKSHGDARGVTR